MLLKILLFLSFPEGIDTTPLDCLFSAFGAFPAASSHQVLCVGYPQVISIAGHQNAPKTKLGVRPS